MSPTLKPMLMQHGLQLIPAGLDTQMIQVFLLKMLTRQLIGLEKILL